MPLRQQMYDMIFERHSRRKYISKSLRKEEYESMENLVQELNNSTEEIRIDFQQGRTDEIFKGIIGGYGKITNAPAYAVFISDTKGNNIEKVGYYGECLILAATELGLGTCWVSGTFNSDVVGKKIKLRENEKIHAITPIGYPEENYESSEKFLRMIARSNRRKSLADICPDMGSKDLPEWFVSGLEAARLAPSAINKQPWIFSYEDNTAKITAVNKSDMARLDCGIAMLHFELGTLHKGVTGKWKALSKPEVALYQI